MVECERPTDRETSEISTCILDGADCIMLGDETAVGNYVAEAIRMLSKSCAEAERCIDYKVVFQDLKKMTGTPGSPSEALASSTVQTSHSLNVDAVVVETESGAMPRYVAKYRPSVPIIACSKDMSVIKHLTPARGVVGFKVKPEGDSLITQAVAFAKEQELVKPGRKVLFIHGMMEDRVDEFALKEIVDVE